MKFGVGFGQESGVSNIRDQVRVAEAAGFTHATYIDVGNIAPDVYVMMTLISEHTKRMRVGQGVTDPITHNPAVIANAAVTLREFSRGRTFVGIGVGGPYGKPFVRPARIDELREAIQFIKKYTAGEDAQIRGQSWHSEWIRRSGWAGQPVPVYMAICGPRTSQLSGEVGDACLSIGMDVTLQQWRKDMVAKGAVAAGRNPEEIDFWVRTQCYLADSKEAVHREVAPYAATCALELYIVLQRKTPDTVDLADRIERRHPGLLDEFKAIYDVWDPYYTERVGGPQTLPVTQRCVDFFLATGTAADVCEQLQALDELGITGVWSVLYSIQDQIGMMQEIGKELISRLA